MEYRGDVVIIGAGISGVCAALARHPDALAGITGRYAVLAADIGFTCAFSLNVLIAVLISSSVALALLYT